MDFNQMLLNPMTQVGLGILGAGGPGVGGWQQIGRGATAGMGNIMANQALKEESEQRKLQAEIARSEMERAKSEAMRQFEMDQQARALQQQRDQAAQAYIQDNPKMAPLYKMGGADAVLGIVEQQMRPKAPDKPPTSYQEFLLAQQDPAFADMLKRREAAKGTKVDITLPGAGSKYVETREKNQAEAMGEARKQAEASYRALGQIDRFVKAAEKGTAGGAQPLISGVQNMLASFGFSSEELQNTQAMAAAVAGMKAEYMKQLGARGLTDQDMKILAEALPRVDTDPNARVAIAEVLRKEHIASINDYASLVEAENQAIPGNKFQRPRWLKNWTGSAPGAAQKSSYSNLWGD